MNNIEKRVSIFRCWSEEKELVGDALKLAEAGQEDASGAGLAVALVGSEDQDFQTTERSSSLFFINNQYQRETTV